MVKQLSIYDCGHACLLHQGILPPVAIKRELAAEDFYQASGGKFNHLEHALTFKQRGIYMIARPDTTKHRKQSAGGTKDRHWVSYRNGKVLEPGTGTEYSVNEFDNWRLERGYGVIVVVPFEGEK